MNVFSYTEIILPYFYLLSGLALIAVGLGLLDLDKGRI